MAPAPAPEGLHPSAGALKPLDTRHQKPESTMRHVAEQEKEQRAPMKLATSQRNHLRTKLKHKRLAETTLTCDPAKRRNQSNT